MYDSVQHESFTQTKSVTVSILPDQYFTLFAKFMDDVFKQDKEVTVIRRVDNTLYFV
jgi:hypothetical protein